MDKGTPNDQSHQKSLTTNGDSTNFSNLFSKKDDQPQKDCHLILTSTCLIPFMGFVQLSVRQSWTKILETTL